MITNIMIFITCVAMASSYEDFALPLGVQYLAELDKIIFIPFIFFVARMWFIPQRLKMNSIGIIHGFKFLLIFGYATLMLMWSPKLLLLSYM
eukprot:UN11270